MHLRHFALVFGLLTAPLVQAQDVKKEDEVKKDRMQLEGTWAAVSAETEGVKGTEEFIKNFTLVFKEDMVTGRHKAKYEIDPTKKPKTIDVTPSEGPEKDKTIEGIYELKENELKVCIAMPGKERPTAFESKPGSGTVLLVLKKEKADK
jgi:uncharacterized protein (TIGR03067 family)